MTEQNTEKLLTLLERIATALERPIYVPVPANQGNLHWQEQISFQDQMPAGPQMPAANNKP